MTEQKLTLPITGMTCANCAANIERVVKKLEGVAEANVNFAAESAAVSYCICRMSSIKFSNPVSASPPPGWRCRSPA